MRKKSRVIPKSQAGRDTKQERGLGRVVFCFGPKEFEEPVKFSRNLKRVCSVVSHSL